MSHPLIPIQGNNKDTRGTQLSRAPTRPTMLESPLIQTGGKTPIGNDKGPEKQVKDNVVNKRKREVQNKYNSGPNKGRQEKAKVDNMV